MEMEDKNHIPTDFEDIAKYAPTLFRIGKVHGYVVPAHYFDELGEEINVSITTNIFPKQHGFAIPNGFFDELSNEINAGIAIENLKSKLPKLGSVPQNYFDELPLEIEANAIASNFPQGNAFTVPVNYFHNLSEDIVEKTSVREVKVVSLFSQTRVWAVAASVALIITTAFFILNNNSTTTNQIANKITVEQPSIDESAVNIDETTMEDALETSTSEQLASVEKSKTEDVMEYIADNVEEHILTSEIKDVN
jgi:hypothetical protein